MQPLACFFGRRKTSDRPGANHGHARLSFLSKQVTRTWLLACFFGRGKTSEAGQYRRGWLAKRSARLSFLSKRTYGLLPGSKHLACFFGRRKTKQRACLSFLSKRTTALGRLLLRSAGEKTSVYLLACLFYLKKVSDLHG